MQPGDTTDAALPVGRRRDAEASRARITAAARTMFAERGYERTTIRAVASAAEVAPALVGRYYPSKAALFFACMPEVEGFEQVSDGDLDGLPERVTRFFVSAWEDPAQSEPLHTWMRAAATDPDAAGRFAELVEEHTIRPLAGALGADDSAPEPWLVSALLVGTAYLRYVVPVGTVADVPAEELERVLAGAVRRLAPPTRKPLETSRRSIPTPSSGAISPCADRRR